MRRSRLFYLWLFAGAVAGGVSYAFGQSQNLFVFRAAARGLLTGEDPYVLRAADYFKYSPTFALLFAPFAWLPAFVSAYAWSVLNFAVAYAGIACFVDDPSRRKTALVASLFGVALSTDGDQSNLLVLGLFLLGARAFERGDHAAPWLVSAGAFIKLFPAMGAAFALFRPRKGRAAVGLACALAAFAVLPLAVVSPSRLLADYRSWRSLLAWDHGNQGWSAMHMAQAGLGVAWSNAAMQACAIALQAVPIALGARFGTDAAWRRTLACSLLSFGILFNHRAEYATYAIAAAAAGIWLSLSAPSRWKTLLVVASMIAPGPFFARADPSVVGAFAMIAAHRVFHPLRVVPAFFVWVWMQRDLLARFVEVRVRWRTPRLAPHAEEQRA